jgi:DNA-binding beta-propeller fold protein YncE
MLLRIPVLARGSRLRTPAFVLLLGLGTLSVSGTRDDGPVLGSGAHRYRWVRDWAKLPAGMALGNTHGCVVVDSQGRVYLNTDTENAVIVFDAQGNFLRSWGKDLAGGLHGMCLVREQGEELLWLAHTGRHQVLKCTLEGEVRAVLDYPAESKLYTSQDAYLPTSVAALEDGGVLVADGYGASWIHHFDAQGKYVASFGGPGEEPGKFRTPHGVALDGAGESAVLLVADRENHRLQRLSPSGAFLSAVEGLLRRPCHMHRRASDLVVADLEGRVTILDAKDQVLVHLGDNPDPAKRAQNGVPREAWRDGEFVAPHCAAWDADGNLYVVDWVSAGRITKLERLVE